VRATAHNEKIEPSLELVRMPFDGLAKMGEGVKLEKWDE
jgi:hypothetical protein